MYVMVMWTWINTQYFFDLGMTWIKKNCTPCLCGITLCKMKNLKGKKKIHGFRKQIKLNIEIKDYKKEN